MFLINLFVLPLLSLCCQSNVWNGIVPLKSTRSDVEKILGKPLPHSVARHAASYETETEKVFVLYSTGPCKNKPSHGWDIPELTVINVDVYPKSMPKVADFKLDGSKFERRADPEILNQDYLTSEELGISVTVDKADSFVTRISYFPESKYDYLMCKNKGRK